MAQQNGSYPLDYTQGPDRAAHTTADEARERLQEMADGATEQLKRVADNADEFAGRAAEQARIYGEKAQEVFRMACKSGSIIWRVARDAERHHRQIGSAFDSGFGVDLYRSLLVCHGLPLFTTRKIECTQDEAWRFTTVALYLSGSQGVYRAVYGSTLVFMTLGDLTFEPIE